MKAKSGSPFSSETASKNTSSSKCNNDNHGTVQSKSFKRLPAGREGEPSRHVCVIGVAPVHDDVLQKLCLSFGEVSSIDRNDKNAGVCVVTYVDVGHAKAAHDALGEALSARLQRRIRVGFVTPLMTNPPESLRCTSVTAGVEVPGLTLLEGFVDASEEEELLGHFLEMDAPWTGPLKRRVQHYGRVFDYRTRHVDFGAEAPPLPECLAGVLRAMAVRRLKPDSPDQLTLNEYKPGQGISPHVDTHSAFEDGLASLTLGSGCVMDMRHPDGVTVKHVYLPRRSLLVMAGAARYQWTHGIASRKTDMVEGVVKKRATRISLTFRRVRDPAVACDCEFEDCCDRHTPVPKAIFLRQPSATNR